MDDAKRIINYSNKIVKIRKNPEGDISDIMFENGNVVPLNQVILMAKNGTIEGYTVVRGKNGGEFLRADPTDTEEDRLEDLPTFR